MRKPAVLIFATVLSSGLLVAIAPAAAPVVRAGATYSGTVADYLNNGPRWHTDHSLRQQATFTVSRDGRHVLHFVGHYAYYCGAGTSTITAASLRIVSGRFSGTGERANANGINYYAMAGRFGPRGTVAGVTYQDDFVFKGGHVSDPYSFRYHPPSQACESRVTGTLAATAARGH